MDICEPAHLAVDGISKAATDKLESWLNESTTTLRSLDNGHPDPASSLEFRNPLNSLPAGSTALSTLERLQINGHLLHDVDLAKMDLKRLRRLELTYLRHIWDEDVEYEIPLSRLQFHLRNTHLTHLVFVQFEPSADSASEEWRPSYNLLVNLVNAASETLQLLHLDGTSYTLAEGDDFPSLEPDLSDAIVSCRQLCILSIRRVVCADTTFLSRLCPERKLDHLSII